LKTGITMDSSGRPRIRSKWLCCIGFVGEGMGGAPLAADAPQEVYTLTPPNGPPRPPESESEAGSGSPLAEHSTPLHSFGRAPCLPFSGKSGSKSSMTCGPDATRCVRPATADLCTRWLSFCHHPSCLYAGCWVSGHEACEKTCASPWTARVQWRGSARLPRLDYRTISDRHGAGFQQAARELASQPRHGRARQAGAGQVVWCGGREAVFSLTRTGGFHAGALEQVPC
jgi:hypothetical protein